MLFCCGRVLYLLVDHVGGVGVVVVQVFCMGLLCVILLGCCLFVELCLCICCGFTWCCCGGLGMFQCECGCPMFWSCGKMLLLRELVVCCGGVFYVGVVCLSCVRTFVFRLLRFGLLEL